MQLYWLYKQMIMIEEDPVLVRWGLHLLDCRISDGGSPSTDVHYDKDLSHTENVREGCCEAKQNDVENDEVIARAFQEELTKVAANEASGSSNSEAYVLAQDWQDPVKEHGHSIEDENNNQKEIYERGNIGTCSSTIEDSFRLGDLLGLPEIADESTLDGEVGKRMNDLVPIPHVPKTNGNIPTPDEEVSDHQRLLNRLQVYELVELKVQGDGNCQFRALSDQIYRTVEHHKFVRQQVLEQLKLWHELYEGYVTMPYDDYLKHMSRHGQWGDHVTLQAAADAYGIKIFIITSFRDTCYIEILPHTPKSKRIIFLSFWAEVHYDSIYPEGEVPIEETKKKSKWWKF